MQQYSPAGEGSPIVPQYNYATGEYMRPSYYNGEDLHGLNTTLNNRNTRMGRQGYAPVPNYMIGTGNSPLHRGGNNLFPSGFPVFDKWWLSPTECNAPKFEYLSCNV